MHAVVPTLVITAVRLGSSGGLVRSLGWADALIIQLGFAAVVFAVLGFIAFLLHGARTVRIEGDFVSGPSGIMGRAAGRISSIDRERTRRVSGGAGTAGVWKVRFNSGETMVVDGPGFKRADAAVLLDALGLLSSDDAPNKRIEQNARR